MVRETAPCQTKQVNPMDEPLDWLLDQREFYKQIGRNIYNERQAAHESQAALGKALHMSEYQIDTIEKGGTPLDVRTTYAIALQMGIPFEELLIGCGSFVDKRERKKK